MEIKELSKLNEKRQQVFSEKSEELRRAKAELEKRTAELEDAFINGTPQEQDKIQEECLRLQLQVNGLQGAVNKLKQRHNPYYTDQDVLNGYAEYAKTYNGKASALKKKYDSGIETAYKAMMENIELRRSGIAAHDEFKKYLCDESAQMAKLETIAVIPQQANQIFRRFLEQDGITWDMLQQMAYISNDTRY